VYQAAGQIDKSIDFGTANNAVEISDSASLDLVNQITISA
jgi:hypothetical protein